MSEQGQESPIPTVAQDSELCPLSDADKQILTDARTASWLLQQYEFAYVYMVKKLTNTQTFLAFSGVVIAVLFVYLQNLVPETHTTQTKWLGNIGTGLSLGVILATIWGSMNQWNARIEKMQRLSTSAKGLLREHQKITAIRPVDHEKIRSWLLKILDFEEERKDPLADTWQIALQRGFQHIGNKHMKRSVVCPICDKEWSSDSNQQIGWPFLNRKCSNCGVKNNGIKNN